VTGPTGWPPLRRRPPRLAKHRALPPTTETDMPPQPAASLPLHITEPAPPPAPPKPDEIVQCGNCQAIGPSSLIPDVPTRGPRCADTDACTRRWYAGKPVSLLPLGAGAVKEVPQPAPMDERGADDALRLFTPMPGSDAAVDAAVTRFEQAHDEQDAAEAGEDRSEDGRVADETTERDIAIASADSIASIIAAAEDGTPDGDEAE
jgi:hypothetical protein